MSPEALNSHAQYLNGIAIGVVTVAISVTAGGAPVWTLPAAIIASLSLHLLATWLTRAAKRVSPAKKGAGQKRPVTENSLIVGHDLRSDRGPPAYDRDHSPQPKFHRGKGKIAPS